MKYKKIIYSLTISGFLSLGMSSFVIAACSKQEATKAKAYSSNTLPTTIDLNDNSTEEIKNYYSSLKSINDQSELQGTNLLKNLKTILKNGQKYYSYDDNYGTPIWQMYEIIDRDWEKSPASSTIYGTYDSINNRLVDYVYGTSNSNKKNDPYVHALYVNRDVDNQSKVWGDHSQEGWGINREHVWAKAHGMKDVETSDPTAGARGDPMHLMAGNGYINGKDWHYHSAYFFGFVDLNRTYRSVDNDESGYTYLRGNYEGYSLNRGSFRQVFEPQDSDKGDIARAIFYMAARYNFFSGYDEDGIDSNNPNLIITDNEYDTYSNSSYVASTSNPGQMGIIRDLLVWNRLDPPDEWEIHRNNLIYNNYTNNRNPFIDYPQWAEYIWGKSSTQIDGRTISVYNPTPTGYASPDTDIINGFNGGVDVTGVEVSESETEMTVGDTYQLNYTIYPNNASNKQVEFWTGNSNIATISETGLVTAHQAGDVYVGVTTADGGYTASCHITVNPFVPDNDYYLIGNSPYINGVPYRMYLDHTIQQNFGRFYFAGEIANNYYGKSSTNINDSVDVYFEYSEYDASGQNIYFYNANESYTKTYIYIYPVGYYVDFGFTTSAPDTAWIYREDLGLLTYDIDGSLCTLGSYNQYTNFAAFLLANYSEYNAFDFISSTKENDDALKAATGMAVVINDNIVCNGSGNTAPIYKTGVSWSRFEFIYSKLENDAKSILATTISSKTGSDLEKGLAKYDYILTKYNTSSTTPYNDFLGRIANNMVTLSNKLFLDYHTNSSTLFILGLATFISVTTLVTLVVIKKRLKKTK